MRILQICSARDIGGGERHLADLANALARRGHEVFAALSPGAPLRKELSALNPSNVIELPMRNALNLRTAMRLSRFVREREIEIVHAHIARDYPLAALATGRSPARLVLTRHVLFPMNPIHKLTLRRTARVIAVSPAVAEALRAQSIFESAKITVIPNGIDVERFAGGRESTAPGSGRFRIGAVGHLAPIKGFDDFIRAAEIVCRVRDDVEFVIVGEDKSERGENRHGLEMLIRELELGDRVKLIGWVDDIAMVLPTFDLFLSTARVEPFGLSIIEARAAGVAVIATASEGAREIVHAGETGVMVPIGNADALAKTVLTLIDSPGERARLAENARRAARNRFSLPRMLDETEQVYAEVASGKN
jgi:glycosyltransferase involved in cell wall biosynthesis